MYCPGDLTCRMQSVIVLNKQMPELANLIEQECGGRKSWGGIIERLWPEAKCVGVISMAPCIPTLQFYTGSLPWVSMMYVSSKGYFGINLNPLSKTADQVSYTLLPNMACYEFRPFNGIHKESTQEDLQNGIPDTNCMVVDLANLKIGQSYELLVTTFTGLYRYRLGDILTVTGFHNNAPQFHFVQRRGVILSVDQDKTSEDDLSRTITRAIRVIEPLGLLLKECTSYVDTSLIPDHYVLFWELQMRETAGLPWEHDPAILEQCCTTVDQSLDSVYWTMRNLPKDIGPLEIIVVKEGTFEALIDYYLSNGSSISRYKTPRCIKSENTIQILQGWYQNFSAKLFVSGDL